MGERMRVAITGGDGMVGRVLQERLDPGARRLGWEPVDGLG